LELERLDGGKLARTERCVILAVDEHGRIRDARDMSESPTRAPAEGVIVGADARVIVERRARADVDELVQLTIGFRANLRAIRVRLERELRRHRVRMKRRT